MLAEKKFKARNKIRLEFYIRDIEKLTNVRYIPTVSTYGKKRNTNLT